MALGCLRDRKGKTLRLKTPHAFDTKFGGIKKPLVWKAPHRVLASIVPRVLSKLPNEEKPPTALPSCEAYESHNEEHSKITPRMQQQHFYLGG